jgi:hypothetical protein
MVTAELAVALPAVVLTALSAVTFLSLVSTQLRTLDAAAVAARLVARGEPSSAVAAAIATVEPGARWQIRPTDSSDPLVVTEVTTRVHVAVFGQLLPAFVVREHAVAVREPGRP